MVTVQFFCIWMPNVPPSFIEKTIFNRVTCGSVSKINCSYLCGFISLLSSLFPVSTCLPWRQHYIAVVTVRLQHVLIEILWVLQLSFFSKIVWTTVVPLNFHKNFTISWGMATKHSASIFIGIVLQLLTEFVENWYYKQYWVF